MTTIAVSAGDPQGIGPEITMRAVKARLARRADLRFIIAGPRRLLLDEWRSAVAEDLPEAITILDRPFDADAHPPSRAAGEAAFGALDLALERVLSGEAEALVTAPLSKEAVAMSRPGFSGHTEYLGERTGARPLMMLATEKLRVTLATVHCPLAAVSARVTRERVREAISDSVNGVRAFYGTDRVKVAVLALNPHAGEGGELGREEIERIAPAIADLGGEKADIFGPFSADSFFVPGSYDRFDVVLAMYHDQGLIPLKALGFGRSVNVTLGLPIIRTSPDHGTAFALAGKGLARWESMALAIEVAEEAIARRGPNAKNRSIPGT